jgi:hypothetical protein
LPHDQNIASEREAFDIGLLDVGVAALGERPNELVVQPHTPSVLNLKKLTQAPEPLVLGFANQGGVDPLRFSWV